MLAQLSQVKGLTEIRDASGKVIGYFTPATLGLSHPKPGAPPQLDPAEIERRKQSQEKGRTTREVFEHLLAVTKHEQARACLQKKIESLKERDECISQ
jgi:hypothetical protein